ncbi:hypothetical protein A3197_17100 [Candidatus Thiodiazotropha endoloripes]|nr:hypothetical protein A3197_17100 [Candidatus Thiodiazotropha endoloripes]
MALMFQRIAHNYVKKEFLMRCAHLLHLFQTLLIKVQPLIGIAWTTAEHLLTVRLHQASAPLYRIGKSLHHTR